MNFLNIKNFKRKEERRLNIHLIFKCTFEVKLKAGDPRQDHSGMTVVRKFGNENAGNFCDDKSARHNT